jgi:hypothetical protein
MKYLSHLAIILGVTLFMGIKGSAQSKYNLGLGYFAESTISPGLVIELERERFHSDQLSIPIQLDLLGFLNKEYNALAVELKTGYRKYFNSGLFIEQNIGVGYQFTKYKSDMWYIDKYAFSVPHGNTLIPWFAASTSVGLGYNLSHKEGTQHLIWLRPKLIWLPGFRGIELPYHAFQIGYTFNIKNK